MDVRCEQCSAEYEFDESLLGEKGTTVKCSSCGHVFRVMPRRDSARNGLRLRHVRTGLVEPLATLRDLQAKIHAGEVTLDDQLGREGFPYRRLGDVPELKNFFGPRVGAAPSSMRADAGTPHPNQPLRVSDFSMPPSNDQPPASRPQGGRTVLGVGPQTPQIPAAPRVPNVHGQAPAPAPREQGEGRFGSEAPTAARSRPDLASLSQAPTVPGVSPSELMGMTGPRPSAGVPLNAPSNNPVRLYLSDDEAPPARATEGSKAWIYLVAAAVIGGGAWLGMAAFSKKDEPPVVAPEAARVETPTPSPEVLPTPAEAAAQAGQPAPSEPAPAKPADKPVVTPAPEPKPTETASASSSGSKDKGKDKADKSKDKDSGGTSDSGADPKDYTGWVAKGDKAFQRGDLPAARKAYESALALRGTGSEANTGLGFTLLGEGKASEAIPHFDRAASSGYADAHIGLGDAYRRLGQKPAAIEAYKDYLERLPGGSKVSYVKRQLETLGAGGGSGAKPAEDAEENEQPSAPPAGDDYRPAGEMEQGTP